MRFKPIQAIAAFFVIAMFFVGGSIHASTPAVPDAAIANGATDVPSAATEVVARSTEVVVVAQATEIAVPMARSGNVIPVPVATEGPGDVYLRPSNERMILNVNAVSADTGTDYLLSWRSDTSSLTSTGSRDTTVSRS